MVENSNEFEKAYTRIRPLGNGYQGAVFQYQRNSDGEMFAVKVYYNFNLVKDPISKKYFETEFELLKKFVGHPNII